MTATTKLLKMGRLLGKREIGVSLIKLQRHISTAEKISPEREFREVEIEVPWGKIAGKHWGPPEVEPIIALHGWQDNAGSLDPLVKHLPKDLSILAVDFPGHGYSSWLPKGMMYANLVYVQLIHRIKQHYNMNRVGLIAHSMGGMMSFNYTALFPQNVKFVVAFDYFKYPTYNSKKYLPRFIQDWEKFFRIEQLQTPAPRTSEQNAMDRYIEGSRNSLDEEMCKILFVRGATRHPDGTVSFNRDPRVQFFLFDNGFSNEQLKEMASRIRCPYAVIKGESSSYNEKKESYFEVLEVIEAHSPDFRFHTMPGTHHFHMKNNSDLAELISPFIKKHL
ncbi:probable serine hydrolase [Diachasma alloeum]|uniref:probable serine hydrolase n=1 Tax=Diachasma alloeum TaxID=454923 RepID=UPI0007384417|nr:probable serine hydrolase [Diachasma alloeum]XP_015118895.1 probable serine hydrolase [Diachasma alloeum]